MWGAIFPNLIFPSRAERKLWQSFLARKLDSRACIGNEPGGKSQALARAFDSLLCSSWCFRIILLYFRRCNLLDAPDALQCTFTGIEWFGGFGSHPRSFDNDPIKKNLVSAIFLRQKRLLSPLFFSCFVRRLGNVVAGRSYNLSFYVDFFLTRYSLDECNSLKIYCQSRCK